METDKKTIGLTEENKIIVEQLKQSGWFNEGLDAARFAMSISINEGIEPGVIEGAETVWNVGSFDQDGELRNLIPIIYPRTESPYRLIEYLVNTGLQIIGKQLADSSFDLLKMMG